jgi:hypothetical protein
MNSFGLLEPSYLSIDSGLNLSGQLTCLSDGARAWKLPLPAGVAARSGEHRGGVNVLARLRLLSSMMLRRSSRSRPYSLSRRFWVICRCASLSARCLLPLAAAAASLRALLARSCDRLPPEGSPWWLPTVGAAVAMLPAVLNPCWAKATSGESGGTIHCIDSKIVWSRTMLKSGFGFRMMLLLGVLTSDASDPSMVGYLLELF